MLFLWHGSKNELGCRKSPDASLSAAAVGSLHIPWGEMLMGWGTVIFFWRLDPAGMLHPGAPPLTAPSSLETSFYNYLDRE